MQSVKKGGLPADRQRQPGTPATPVDPVLQRLRPSPSRLRRTRPCAWSHRVPPLLGTRRPCRPTHRRFRPRYPGRPHRAHHHAQRQNLDHHPLRHHQSPAKGRRGKATRRIHPRTLGDREPRPLRPRRHLRRGSLTSQDRRCAPHPRYAAQRRDRPDPARWLRQCQPRNPPVLLRSELPRRTTGAENSPFMTDP